MEAAARRPAPTDPAAGGDAPVRAGSPREVAIPRLLDLHGPRLYALGLRLCGGPHDAEDLVQDTFLQAWRRWDRFEGRSDPGTWLWTIAARACSRRRRRKAGEPASLKSLDDVVPFGGGPVATLGDGGESALDGAVRREARERLEEAIAGLPDRYRLPLVLQDALGMAGAEVAAILGLRPGTVRVRIHRARLQLRAAVAAALPSRDAPPTPYSRRVCMDLLEARQEALDRGVPFPVDAGVACDRCRSVFATLGLTHDLCADLARGALPAAARTRVMAALAGPPSPSPTGGRP